MNTSALLKPFEEDLDIFRKRYEVIMSSNIPLINTIAKYLVKHKGKQLRPLIVLVCGRLCGKPTEHTYTAAAVIELLHVASLVHDDIIDNSDTRRGFLSIKSKWTNKIAVLMGDYLLSKSLLGAIETDNLRVMKILSNAAKRLTKGELFQLEKRGKFELLETEYYQLISDKTAALFSACSELGALTVSDSEEEIEALRTFGENLGIAFQIKDDLLDYESTGLILGKPAGADIKDKKLTLPLLYTFHNSPEKDVKKLIKRIKKGASNKDVKEIISYVEEKGGIEYTRKKLQDYSEKAKNSLSIFPDSK